MNTGPDGNVLTRHHVTIIPAKPLMNAQMNEKQSGADTTKCGYAGSDMVKAVNQDESCSKVENPGSGSTLENIYEEYIKPDFDNKTIDGKEHVIEYRNLLTNAMDDKRTNRFGQNTGASSNWEWYPRKLDLMSEMNVYGGIVASSSVYDTGIDNRQYAIFRLKPEFINSYGGKQFQYWLKDVATSTVFTNVGSSGNAASDGSAGTQFGVRPRFLIGEFFNLILFIKTNRYFGIIIYEIKSKSIYNEIEVFI